MYRYANVGNHLHLLIRVRSRKDWQGFIRAFSGGVVMPVTVAKKGEAFRRGKSFWDHLLFTWIVSFGRDFNHVAKYVLTNLWEGLGVPVRRLLLKGYRVLEISESGGVFVSTNAGAEIIRLLT